MPSMKPARRLVIWSCCLAGFGTECAVLDLVALQAPTQRATATLQSTGAPTVPEPKNWTAAEDHQNMMDQLGIRTLRPGPSGNESAPNHANYDEATANPFPDLPDVLTLKNGRKVTSADAWVERRKEIVDDFEREVFGRIPSNVPQVTWTVAETANGALAGRSVIGKRVVGHVDNTSYPAISVDIQLTLVTPADAGNAVPMMIMFRGGGLAQALGAPPEGRGVPARSADAAGGDPAAIEQLIADGWGYAFLDPASIQADNGAGLT